MSIDVEKLKEEIAKRKSITTKFVEDFFSLISKNPDGKDLNLSVTIPKEFDFFICAAVVFNLEHNRYAGVVNAITRKYGDLILLLCDNKNDILNGNIPDFDILVNQVVNIMFHDEVQTLNSWYY